MSERAEAANCEGADDSRRSGDHSDLFEVHVVDEATGKGVPLVTLRTTDETEYVTDSAGRIALRDPGLMGRDVFVHVSGHGYRYPADESGYEGTTLSVTPGGKRRIAVERENVAERLYRVTGRGIYRDSVVLGYEEDVPLRDPVLACGVTGLDSVYTAVYDGRLFWFWGDTDSIAAPLGNFRTTGATSRLPADGGLDPAEGVDLDYFDDGEGFVRPLAPLPSEDGDLMWIDRLVTVPDEAGEERLVARYSQMAGLHDQVGSGLLVFDDDRAAFDVLETDMEFARGHGGQPLRYDDPDTGEAYWAFANPFPLVRVPDSLTAVRDPDAYEYFTCLEPGVDADDPADLPAPAVRRDDDGGVAWEWRRGADPVGQRREAALLDAGLLDPGETRFQLVDADGSEDVALARASIAYNDYRGRWIAVGQQTGGGPSDLGELWYAEADDPTGPWRTAAKIVTHDEYTFYNPAQHPYFAEDGGRHVYFEATYTNTFSESDPTPLYDYNQVMYRLDLDHPRLDLPLA